MAERLKATVLKTVVGRPTGGSNPSSSATYSLKLHRQNPAPPLERDSLGDFISVRGGAALSGSWSQEGNDSQKSLRLIDGDHHNRNDPSNKMNQTNEKFGNYTLLERIAVGGMAEVFLARQTSIEGFEKEIVIKRIRPHLSEQKSFVNMFLAEARLAAQLSHSNIVQIYDLGNVQDSYFIAMEYLAGRDLSALIPKTRKLGIPFPIEYALRITSSICEALHYAHNKTDDQGAPLNIVHRDISPENIRVGWTGDVKILDFGIAKAASHVHETKAGEIKGKLCYMAPEQVLGKPVDRRSDLFSVGIILYELLTGLKLYTGTNDLDIMNKIVEGKIHPPGYFRDNVPPEVEAITMKALTKSRDARYQNANDLQFDIDQFLSGHEFTPSKIHLSNFVKQLFRQELAEEHLRRQSASHPTPAPAPEKNATKTAPFSPPLPENDRALPRSSSNELPETSPLQIRVTDAEMTQLGQLGEPASLSPQEVVEDIIQHYLKYQH